MKQVIVRRKPVLSKCIAGILLCILISLFLASFGVRFVRKGKTYPPNTDV